MKYRLSVAPLSVALLTFVAPLASAAPILFVGGSGTVTATDQNIINRLTGFGNTVTYVSAPVSTTADAVGKSAVFVSSTVASGDVAAKFQDVTAGVFAWEQAIQYQSRQDLLTELAERGNDGSFTQLTITPTGAASPLAAGLAAGTYTVTTAPHTFGYGNSAGFGSGATGVAVRGDGLAAEANRFGIYSYDVNSVRPSGDLSQGRRVYFFLNDTSFDNLNATGLALFDAAAQYVGAAVPEPSAGALVGMAAIALLGRRRARA